MSSPIQSSSQIRLLLVEDVAQVSQFVKGLVEAQAQMKLLDVVTDGTIVLDQIRELRPDVVVVDALLAGKMNGLEVAEGIRRAGYDLPIICLTVPQKHVAVGKGMGVTRVLTMPVSGFDFVNTVKQMAAEYAATSPSAMSRLYAFFGPKGGVGTSTLAYNVGAAIAATGERSVALVDGSLQFADLRALLQADDELPSLLQLPISQLTQADVERVAWRDPSGMDVFFAPPRPEMAEMVTTKDLGKLLSLLRRLYNVVIVDTATSLADPTLAILDAADQVVVVIAFERTILRQARTAADTFARIGYAPEKLVYVVNRSDSTGGLPASVIEQHTGRRADFSVVSDWAVVQAATNRSEPFVHALPAAKISGDIRRIAEALATPASNAPQARAVAGA